MTSMLGALYNTISIIFQSSPQSERGAQGVYVINEKKLRINKTFKVLKIEWELLIIFIHRTALESFTLKIFRVNRNSRGLLY